MTATTMPEQQINVCPNSSCRIYIYGGLVALAAHINMMHQGDKS